MLAEPHRSTMDRIDEWCDEATFVNWQQTEVSLPDWDVAYERLLSDGHVVDLRDASPDTLSERFRRPHSHSSYRSFEVETQASTRRSPRRGTQEFRRYEVPLLP